ncbi:MULTISPECIES: hypothetical protein [unclassified Streptomyces]|uniref:hypothetical protein n=1 Tax=unclassified Streptomyces TaxID=2593676 RepID=UPI000DBA73F3|nr:MULTISPECIES: hypothetical protein [unclassified Streptomyces]MYT72718.1 hypothetical protein [Streptomyces sp. SID8367]RAJ79575.1 hypothetical protein K377_05297 [Streptomyces sp. PsTaAH-137]
MPEHVSILQQIGLAALALVTVAWVVGLVRLVRVVAVAPPEPPRRLPLGALPGQAQAPAVESVPLTADEQDAFAGLVRQFSRR